MKFLIFITFHLIKYVLKTMNWKKADTKTVLLLWNNKFPAKFVLLSSERVTHNCRLYDIQ